MIWMMECVVMFVVTIFVWLLHHAPYFMLLMVTLTLWFTQPTITANMRRWWLSVLARWEEFEQHEESMEQLQQQQQQQFPLIAQAEYTNGTDPRSQYTSAVLPPQTVPVAREPLASVMASQTPFCQQRPPLHGPTPHSYSSATPVQPMNSGQSVSDQGWLAHVTNRAQVAISSVFGREVRRYDNSTPPGLYNPGQNICFLNVVLQALAHTPSLSEAVGQLKRLNPTDLLVREFASLVDRMTSPVTIGSPLALDTYEFRTCASSEFPDGLVQRPYQTLTQRQQDAAECLTWIVEWLHARMNRAMSHTAIASQGILLQQNGLGPRAAVMHTPQRFTAMTVNCLKLKYDGQSRQSIADIRSSAINQIETADGMNTGLYIGSLNTVSDIDWYRHHCSTYSPVNDLFVGQLVDMRLCDACRRVAISTQLFHVLPVPIAEPMQFRGLVSLEACLSQFVKIERMGGTNGLMCDHCNRFRSRSTTTQDQDVAVTPVGNHVTPLSPISAVGGGASSPLSDASSRDIQQRTSTPISTQHRLSPAILTDCRRRSMVGYLPACLVVQLMRFNVVNGGQSMKISLPVVIPLNGLDMSSYVLHNVDPAEAGLTEPSLDHYNLYAVCLHLGSNCTTNGHYIAYARCADNVWYCFDDDRVRAVNMEYELTTRLVRENAYLLFYERVL